MLLMWIYIFVVLVQALLGTCNNWETHCNHSTLPAFPTASAIANAVRKLDTQVWVNARQHVLFHQIPSIIWVTVKDVPAHVPPHHMQMLQNNTNFRYLVVSDADADLFMNEVFYNTSYLWAYHSMNKKLGAGKADIFRYAVMYVFGGVYIDEDSAWFGNLEKYIQPQDGFIAGTENQYIRYRPCYQTSFYLGSEALIESHFVNSLPWKDMVVEQNMLVSRPRHPFITRTMWALMDIFRRLKCLQDKKLFVEKIKKDATLLCSTGPDMMTMSIRSYLHDTPPSNWTSSFGLRYAGVYFSDVEGAFRAKAGSDVQGASHWTTYINQGTSIFGDD